MRRTLAAFLGVAALTAGLVSPVAASPPDPTRPALTASELSALSSDIFARLNRPTSLGAKLSYTGVDSKANRVEIGVIDYTPALAQRLAGLFGTDRVRVVPAQEYRATVLKIRKSESALRSRPEASGGVGPQDTLGGCTDDGVFCVPTRGGVLLEQDAGGGFVEICSSTILGTSRAGQSATLTAGHCFRRPGPVFYGTATSTGLPVGGQLGDPGERIVGGTSDHLVIPWFRGNGATGRDYLNNCIFVPGVNCVRMNFNAATSDIPVGTEVAQRGYTTGRTTGRITLTSGTVNVRLDEGTVVTMSDMALTSACSLPGDSGGAAFVRGDRLVGTIAAGNPIKEPGQPARCDPSPRSWIAKATNAYQNLGFNARLWP